MCSELRVSRVKNITLVSLSQTSSHYRNNSQLKLFNAGSSPRKIKDYSLNGFRLNIIWISLCWTLLAKPTFFLGNYLSRINIISEVKQAISLIPNNSKVLTTSYIVPHLTKRKVINWAKSKNAELDNYDVLLLNPNDPGWQSTKEIQNYHIENSISKGWKCQVWESSLHLCMKQNKYSN